MKGLPNRSLGNSGGCLNTHVWDEKEGFIGIEASRSLLDSI